MISIVHQLYLIFYVSLLENSVAEVEDEFHVLRLNGEDITLLNTLFFFVLMCLLAISCQRHLFMGCPGKREREQVHV